MCSLYLLEAHKLATSRGGIFAMAVIRQLKMFIYSHITSMVVEYSSKDKLMKKFKKACNGGQLDLKKKSKTRFGFTVNLDTILAR